MGAGETTPNHQSVYASIETKSPWPPLVHFLRSAATGSVPCFRKRQPRHRHQRSDNDARQIQDRALVCAGFTKEMNVKRSQILLSILAMVGAMAAQADDIVPKKLNFDRYTAMLNRSPFAVATAVAPASTTPSWSKDLYVANAAHTADADYVTIISGADKSVKEYLSTKGPNEDGYAIANIQWSDKPGRRK